MDNFRGDISTDNLDPNRTPNSSAPSWSFDNGHHNHHQNGQHHHHHNHHQNMNYNGEFNDSIGKGGGNSYPPLGRKRQHPPGTADGGLAKLYVGGVPRTVTEQDIRSVFGEHGNVVEVVLLKDKRTGLQQECCFVKYAKFEDADQAIAVLHNQYMFSGGITPVRVKYADGERRRPVVKATSFGTCTNKLYVGWVNKQASSSEIEEIFSPYGLVEDVFIVRDEWKQSRGCAFVEFSHRDMAVAAINALNGTYIMRGCDQPFIVRFADPKKPKIEESRPVPYVNDPPNQHRVPNSWPLSADTTDFQDCEWSEHVCPDGNLYYFNCATCESRWEKPEDYCIYEQQLQQGHP